MVIARGPALAPRRGADALWIDVPPIDEPRAGDVPSIRLPVGADAADATHVERLVRSGVVLVGVRAGDHDAVRAAAEVGASVLVDPADVGYAVALLPAERLLVAVNRPAKGAIACCSPEGEGPVAWGEVVAALAAGVRVVRAPGVPSVLRVTTVVDRLLRERKVLAG